MNRLLLRPQSGLDPSTAVYLNAVAAADGSQLEAGVRKAIDDFVKGCKRDGLWSALGDACILMGARTLSGALVPLSGVAPTNNNFVSGDYDRKTGLLGDGTTKSLRVNVTSNLQDDFSLSTYVSGAPTMTDLACIMGWGQGSAFGTTHIRLRSTPAIEWRHRSGGGSVQSSSMGTGFAGSSRSGSASFIRRYNGSNTTSTTASATGFGSAYHVYAGTDSTGAATNRSNPRLAWFHYGTNIDLALLDARVSALYTAIGAALA